MPMTITINLSDSDLKRFDQVRDSINSAHSDKTIEEVTNSASELLRRATKMDSPEYVNQRFRLLGALIQMVRDEGWALSQEDVAHVRSALVYFSTATDAIPDEVPVFGLLDDAIAIEVCALDLRDEVEAYHDFCDYRQKEADRRGLNPDTVGRADWLAGKREELQERMRRRRPREFGAGYGRSSGYGPAPGYFDGWRS